MELNHPTDEATPIDDEEALDALLAALDDEATEKNYADLEKDCLGSAIVATVNHRLGRENCNRCHQHSHCNELLHEFRNDVLIKKCFGDHITYPPHVVFPKEYCYICSKAESCRQTRYYLYYGIAEPTAASDPENSATTIAAPTAEPKEHQTKNSTPSVPVTSEYSFPILEIRDSGLLSKYTAMSTQELHDKLKELGQSVENPSETNYLPFRNKICAISLALNAHGNDMPRFRPGYRGNFKKGGKPRSDQDSLIANDMRVIDLDWLAQHRRKVNMGASEKLFLGAGLDFDAASAFVSVAGSGDKKTEILGLSQFDQVPLSALQGTDLSKRWQSLKSRGSQCVSEIEDAIQENRGRRTDAPEWLWMIYVVYRLLDNDIGKTRKLSRWLGQEEPSSVKLKRTVTWLRETAKLPM